MNILKAKWIISCDDDFSIFKDFAVAFNDKIIEINTVDKLLKKYKNSNFIDLKDSAILPAFINTHSHLEFSANNGLLHYGEFVNWLGSIVNFGNNIAKKTSKIVINNALKEILKSGTCTIGAISSFGLDLESLLNSKLRVVLFNELLGSNPNDVEKNWQMFLNRFNYANSLKNDKFTPAISLHAPYSLHPKLAKMVVEFAKENSLICSTHFMESFAEKQWLNSGVGKFKSHLKRFVPSPLPMYSPDSFLSLFDDLHTLFTHCVWVDDFSKFDKKNHFITHCPISNRLLGKKALNIKKVLKNALSLNIGTDGLSSNFSLNILNELKAALFANPNLELNSFARELLLAATIGGARALGTNNGMIKNGRFADIVVLSSPDTNDTNQLAAKIILQNNNAKMLFINGNRVL